MVIIRLVGINTNNCPQKNTERVKWTFGVDEKVLDYYLKFKFNDDSLNIKIRFWEKFNYNLNIYHKNYQ